jgi:RNA polymerase sigma factor (sigma-70 family)
MRRCDAAAFESLYKAHSKHVYSICLRMLKDVAETKDLTQQVFLRLFREIGTFRGESVFWTRLHRVIISVVLMHLRPTEVLIDGDLKEDGVCADYIREKLQVGASTASQHLKILTDGGLIRPKRIEQRTFFKRCEPRIRKIKKEIGLQLWKGRFFPARKCT